MICNLCPRACGAVRTEAAGSGYCRMPEGPVLARAALHHWEEPPISGTNGSGTIFFSGCSLGCVFCQNEKISHEDFGKPVSLERLREICGELIAQGAHNINFVNPTHYAHVLARLLEEPLGVPVVYNSGGYERVETLKALEGKVDIYLPDLKYADDRLAISLSGAPGYFQTAIAAIREMVRQTGPVQWQGDKVIRGVIVRHLILPGCIENSLKVLDALGETFAPGEILVSLMRQYTPMGGLPAPFDRRVTDEEYDAVLSWMFLNDLEGFTQDAEAADRGFIPDF